MDNNFNIKKKNQYGFDLPFWLPDLGYFGFLHKRLRLFFLTRTERPKFHYENSFPDGRFLPAKFESASFLLIFSQRQTNYHVNRTLTGSVRNTERQ
jgi:hypothetical protein